MQLRHNLLNIILETEFFYSIHFGSFANPGGEFINFSDYLPTPYLRRIGYAIHT